MRRYESARTSGDFDPNYETMSAGSELVTLHAPRPHKSFIYERLFYCSLTVTLAAADVDRCGVLTLPRRKNATDQRQTTTKQDIQTAGLDYASHSVRRRRSSCYRRHHNHHFINVGWR